MERERESVPVRLLSRARKDWLTNMGGRVRGRGRQTGPNRDVNRGRILIAAEPSGLFVALRISLNFLREHRTGCCSRTIWFIRIRVCLLLDSELRSTSIGQKEQGALCLQPRRHLRHRPDGGWLLVLWSLDA
jgi:hypothetical protein